MARALSAPHAPRRRRMLALGAAYCDVCAALLLQYVDAANEVVELKRRGRVQRSEASADLKAAVLRVRVRRVRLALHQKEHQAGLPDPRAYRKR